MKGFALLISLAVVTAVPESSFSNQQQVRPHNFGFGVNAAHTGDEKEHKQTVSPTGAVQGEYRWLQPNGLYRVTRYTADDVAGYQAVVSEEPGNSVVNYHYNDFDGSVASQALVRSQGNQLSPINYRSSSGQGFTTSSQTTQNKDFRSTQTPGFQNQNFGQSSYLEGRFIDVGIIDGGIIDGGIIDGGIIDGGIIDGGIIDGGIIIGSSSAGRRNTFGSPNRFSSGSSSIFPGFSSHSSGSNRQRSDANIFRSSASPSRAAVVLAGNTKRFST